MKTGLQLTVGNIGCLHEDEIDSFLAYDLCAGCYVQFSHHEDGENRRLYAKKYYCELCYFKKLSSSIVDSMLDELNKGRKESGLVVQVTA